MTLIYFFLFRKYFASLEIRNPANLIFACIPFFCLNPYRRDGHDGGCRACFRIFTHLWTLKFHQVVKECHPNFALANIPHCVPIGIDLGKAGFDVGLVGRIFAQYCSRKAKAKHRRRLQTRELTICLHSQLQLMLAIVVGLFVQRFCRTTG